MVFINLDKDPHFPLFCLITLLILSVQVAMYMYVKTFLLKKAVIHTGEPQHANMYYIL